MRIQQGNDVTAGPKAAISVRGWICNAHTTALPISLTSKTAEHKPPQGHQSRNASSNDKWREALHTASGSRTRVEMDAFPWTR